MIRNNNYKLYKKLIKKLIDSNCNIEVQDRLQNTALFILIKNCPEIATILAKKVKNLNITNQCGNTALHIAIKHNHFTIARTLIDRGCKFDIKNKKNMDAMYLVLKTITQNNTLKIYNYIILPMIRKGYNINKKWYVYGKVYPYLYDIIFPNIIILKKFLFYHKLDIDMIGPNRSYLFSRILRYYHYNDASTKIMKYMIQKGCIIYKNTRTSTMKRPNRHHIDRTNTRHYKELRNSLANVSLYYRCIRHINMNIKRKLIRDTLFNRCVIYIKENREIFTNNILRNLIYDIRKYFIISTYK